VQEAAEPRIEADRPGACGDEEERRAHQREREFEAVVAGQEPVRQVHEHDRRRHRTKHAERCDARQQAEDQAKAAEKLTRDREQREQGRQRHPELLDMSLPRRDVRQLLKAVHRHDHADRDAQHQHRKGRDGVGR
jgi:hypothetical protein